MRKFIIGYIIGCILGTMIFLFLFSFTAKAESFSGQEVIIEVKAEAFSQPFSEDGIFDFLKPKSAMAINNRQQRKRMFRGYKKMKFHKTQLAGITYDEPKKKKGGRK